MHTSLFGYPVYRKYCQLEKHVRDEMKCSLNFKYCLFIKNITPKSIYILNVVFAKLTVKISAR
jgi:hypothetical protein